MNAAKTSTFKVGLIQMQSGLKPDANLAAALIRSNHINALAALEKCLPVDKATK